MVIGLINENSQASKNKIIYETLCKVAKKYGHTVLNFGTKGEEDKTQLTYVEVGLLSAILINSHTVDFIVTGCGTGEGAMLACNSFPNVLCGHICDPSDAYMFMQINNGNVASFPFAKGFGWGAELNLEFMFNELFAHESGKGYPIERAVAEQKNKKILDDVKKVTHKDMLSILKELDPQFVKHTISGDSFKDLFKKHCKENEVSKYILGIIE